MKKFIGICAIIVTVLTASITYASSYYTREYPIGRNERIIEVYKDNRLYAVLYKCFTNVIVLEKINN